MSVEVFNTVGAPQTLDAGLFQGVLENLFFDKNVKLKTLRFEMGSASGDNYCSQIYRVWLGFEYDGGPPQSMSVIVKSVSMLKNARFLDDLAAFPKECDFYVKLLPRMDFLLKSVKLAPKIYEFIKEPVNALVLEDFAARGYLMANRELGLDFQHSQLVMRKLGQLHAISMVLYQQNPDSMRTYSSGFLSAKAVNGSQTLATIFGNNLQGIIDLISTWEGFASISTKLRRYRANLKDNLIKSQLPIPGELKVFNHGDLWVNNCLFRYSESIPSSVEDVVFVDFQMSVFGSPGYDLNYFMHTSLHLDVLRERRYDLIRVYHSEMVKALRAHCYKAVPSLREILLEVRRREPYGFFAIFGVLPGAMLNRANSGDSNLDNLMDKNFAKKKLEIVLSTRRMQDTLRYTLKRFDKLGIWESI